MKKNVWIFQANPERYNIFDAFFDKSLNEGVWFVNQYKDKISKRDIILFWVSGKRAGIYAVGKILSNPCYIADSEKSSKYWISKREKINSKKRALRIKFEYKMKFPEDPIKKKNLIKVSELQDLAILKRPQGTNFPVSNKEWKILSKLINRRKRRYLLKNRLKIIICSLCIQTIFLYYLLF